MMPSSHVIAFALFTILWLCNITGNMAAADSEARNMRLVGAHDLDGRRAYQPTIKRQGDRYILYVAHHAGGDNGTSIIDVTDPSRPASLTHLAASGGAQHAQVCSGSELPAGDPDAVYLLRTRGNTAHEIWDVTAPARPAKVTTILDGLGGTHKSWWECDTGIAYLNADLRDDGWSTSRGLKIFDLSNPATPRFIRNFGLAGSEPGGAGTGGVSARIHEPTRNGDRIYLAYGTGTRGTVQILDRTKLLNDPALDDPVRPSTTDLLRPQIARIDLPSHWGGHTAWAMTGIDISEYGHYSGGTRRDFLVLVSETYSNGCSERMHHMAWFLDITEERRPFPVSNYHVRESDGDFCSRGGRFGAHSMNWSQTAPFYGRVVVFAWFNAGARAVDVRNPYRPREIGFYIPAPNGYTNERCDSRNGCRKVAQTNNVEVDDRGYIYLVDRAGGGLHIVELTGPARAVLDGR